MWNPSCSRYGRQPGALEVLGHDLRARRQRRLDPGLALETPLDGVPRQQPGREHDGGIGGVRAARDRRDHDGSVLELELLPVIGDLDRLGALGHDRGRHSRRRIGLRIHVRRRPRVLVDGGVARGEGLGERLVVSRVVVVDPEALERGEERVLGVRQRHPVLRPARSRQRGLDIGEVELQNLRVGRLLVRVVEEALLLAVRLDQRDPLRRAPGHAKVVQRGLVHGEEAARRPVLRRHVPERRPVGERKAREALAEVLDELAHHACRAQDLRHGENEVGRSRALSKLAREAEAEHLRHEHRDRLAQHRGLGLDPADAPAQHAQAVDHRGVRVRADERVGERPAVAGLDHAREELEVDLVDDARVRRDDLEVVEGLLTPAQEGVALAVPRIVLLDVLGQRGPAGEGVDLDGVVDHQLRRKQRVDPGGVAAQVPHRVAHRREVDHRGHACEVLEQHARGRERDLSGRVGLRVPARDRLDLLRAGLAVRLRTQDVLEQDPQRVRQPEDVVLRLERVEPDDLVALAPDAERRAGSEAVAVGHRAQAIGWPL